MMRFFAAPATLLVGALVALEAARQMGLERKAERFPVAGTGAEHGNADEVRAGPVDVQLAREVPDDDADGGLADVDPEVERHVEREALPGRNLEAVGRAGVPVASQLGPDAHIVLLAGACRAAVSGNHLGRRGEHLRLPLLEQQHLVAELRHGRQVM